MSDFGNSAKLNFEDFARLASSSASSFALGAKAAFEGAQKESQELWQTIIERITADLKLASQAEIETLKQMVAVSRETESRLEQRIKQLEEKLANLSESKPS